MIARRFPLARASDGNFSSINCILCEQTGESKTMAETHSAIRFLRFIRGQKRGKGWSAGVGFGDAHSIDRPFPGQAGKLELQHAGRSVARCADQVFDHEWHEDNE